MQGTIHYKKEEKSIDKTNEEFISINLARFENNNKLNQISENKFYENYLIWVLCHLWVPHSILPNLAIHLQS